MNCPGRDRTGSPLVLRRGDRGGGTSRKVFSTEEAGRTSRARSKGSKRFARSAISILRPSTSSLLSPSQDSSWITDGTCFPDCRKQRRIQAIPPRSQPGQSLESASLLTTGGQCAVRDSGRILTRRKKARTSRPRSKGSKRFARSAISILLRGPRRPCLLPPC